MVEAMLSAYQMPVLSRFINKGEHIQCSQKYWGHPSVFFAIGFNTLTDNSFWMKSSDPVNVALDIAHGDMVKAHETTASLRENPFVGHIMSGSICTVDAALRAVKHGCTHLRIGVGPGAACTTRIKTGVGAPNLSAVYRIHKHLENHNLRNGTTLIADGGVKEPGDAAKYLAAGADAVMMGSALSKTRESAGWRQSSGTVNGRYAYSKSYRGQASADFQNAIFGKANACPEGAASAPFRWDNKTYLHSIVDQFRGGVSSSCSYIGATSIKDMRHVAEFIKVTSAGYLEGTPHGV
jgi:IMP dehydrogenase